MFTKKGKKEVLSMPKIIEGAREKIMANAKRRLFEKGYQHLSLREVAKESGIATGTIYNYFVNKDYLQKCLNVHRSIQTAILQQRKIKIILGEWLC